MKHIMQAILFVATALIVGVSFASALSCAPLGPKIGTIQDGGSLVDVQGFSTEEGYSEFDTIVGDYLSGEDFSELQGYVFEPNQVILSEEAQEFFTPDTGDIHVVWGMGPMCATQYKAFYTDGGTPRALEYTSSYDTITVQGKELAFSPASTTDCGDVYCSTPVELTVDGETYTLSLGETQRFDGFTVTALRSDYVPRPGFENPRGSGWEEDHLDVLILFGTDDTSIPVEPDGGIGDGAGPLGEEGMCAQVITYAINPETQALQQFPTPCDVPQGWQITDTPIPVEPDGGIGDGAGPLEEEMCAQVITYAFNPETNAVQEFPTPCDVPQGWELTEEPIPVESDGGIGNTPTEPESALTRFFTWLRNIF